MCRCNGSGAPARATGPSSPPPPRPARTDEVALRYLGRTALLVKGPVTGRVYALRPGEAHIDCDGRDVATFLASPLFERFGS